ncbi:MAG: ATP-binding cassette domain-containing protein [Clostridia bacterium]|nr:ATP-binding cassette domain-containing protein [Clostridia bacterium]
MIDNEEILLKVENLCQYFKMGRQQLKAVDHVSFDIKKGEVFGLVGESGCGKTTTGRSIIKLYNITGGNVYFKGRRICAGTLQYKEEIAKVKKECSEQIAELKKQLVEDPTKAEVINAKIAEITAQKNAKIAEQRKLMAEAIHDHKHGDELYAEELVQDIKNTQEPILAELKETNPEAYDIENKKYRHDLRVAKRSRFITRIQMIFQDPIASLDPRMTVREIISEGLVINGIKDKEYIDNKVYEILETVGLVREHADRYPHEFSGGQRQRIGIARAVVMEPEMIIADEPVSALDVSIQAQVINLLNDLRRKLGLTILFIAHDLSVVKYFSDRIGVMYFGKLVELTTSEELFAHPLHPYTKSLLSAIPLPDPHYEKGRVRKTYNPIAEHDYSVNQPSLREVKEGHFVYCNDEEEIKYKKELGLEVGE